MAEVNAAGNCIHPIRLSGETVNLATGEVRRANLLVPCKDRRSVICPPCSYLYKADAFIIVATGLRGGKGVAESIENHPKFFVTLTAPGFGPVHSTGSSSGVCKSRNHREYCSHGLPLWCYVRHDDDRTKGTPLCSDCFDYRAAVLWNAQLSSLWHRTLVNLRRSLAAHHHVTEHGFNAQVKLNYLKIAEVQRRGLIHVHAVFRLDGPNGPDSPPPPWIKIDQVKLSIARVIRETKVTDVDGVPLAWGSQFDIQDLVTSSESGRKVTAYLAKYTTKTTDDSTNFARRFNSRQQIEYLRGNSHLQRMALTAWDLESESTLRSLKLREHANTLGFRSQLITKSRSFSTTFTQLRRARTDFRSQQTSIDPVKASFLYDGRGYDDPSASRLAEVMFKMSKELREDLSRKQRAELRSTQVID
ncbi:MAG TPA: replication initiator [Acidimicrobiales bacterium]|nr:replication initiator [Acidimicrobiales bacterium]